MNKKESFATILTWAAILIFSMLFSNSIPIIRSLRQQFPWIQSSTIIQTTFLIGSLLIIIIIGRRRFAHFGFKAISVSRMLKSIAIGISVGIILFFGIVITFHLVTKLSFVHSGSAMGFSELFEQIIRVWIGASFIEELFYRGVLQTGLTDWMGSRAHIGKCTAGWPILISALLFGAAHLCLLSFMPAFIVINIVMGGIIISLLAGYQRQVSGSLIPAYIIHVCYNIVNMVFPIILHRIGG